jgi:hypothetical protein
MNDSPAVLYVDLAHGNVAYLGPHRLAGPNTRNVMMAALNALANLGAPSNAAVTFRRLGRIVRSVRLDHGLQPSERTATERRREA